jgi:hypothetical protein
VITAMSAMAMHLEVATGLPSDPHELMPCDTPAGFSSVMSYIVPVRISGSTQDSVRLLHH